MLITVNGKTKELQNTLTIGQYLEEKQLCAQPDRSRIKMKEFCQKAEYSTTVLHEKRHTGNSQLHGRWKINRNILISHYNIRKKDLNYEYK